MGRRCWTIKDFKRSSLPAISLATVAAGDYYTTPYIEYDVWTATLGTTTTFTVTLITAALQADSTALLTEVGMVSVPDLNYALGGINRVDTEMVLEELCRCY